MSKYILFLLVLLISNKLLSTECQEVPLPVEVLRTEHIFEGEAIDVQEIKGEIVVSIRVTYYYKGDTVFNPKVKIGYLTESHQNKKLFGLISNVKDIIGRKFIVYGYKASDHIIANICSRTLSDNFEDFIYHKADLLRFLDSQNSYLNKLWFNTKYLDKSEKPRSGINPDSLYSLLQNKNLLMNENNFIIISVMIGNQGKLIHSCLYGGQNFNVLQEFQIPLMIPLNDERKQSPLEVMMLDYIRNINEWQPAKISSKEINSSTLIKFEFDSAKRKIIVDFI